jgi:AhpD family alkylhydroperoxidase
MSHRLNRVAEGINVWIRQGIDPPGHDVAPLGSQPGRCARLHRRVLDKEFQMQMLDWNAYRKQLVAAVGNFAKLSPDTVKGYTALGGAAAKTGHLDAKTRELIALAVAVSLRCDGCITVHSAAARGHGASKEEIAEALGVAVSVNAGAAIVYSTRTLDAYDAVPDTTTAA